MEYKRGTPRKQLYMFDACLDNIIDENNKVRFIDVFIDKLCLEELGFKVPKLQIGTSPFDPKDLLKIYTYGYHEGVRSSRKLEKECYRNQEMIWLTKGLKPDHKTIANFRKDNPEGIKNVFKEFLLFCNKLGILSLGTVAIDGTKMRAQNSKNEVYHRNEISKRKERIDKAIDQYLSLLDEEDKKGQSDIKIDEAKVKKVIETLKKKQIKIKQIQEVFEQNEDIETYFATDPDSRFQSDKGSIAPGYNSQIGTESKNKLIIINDVTNDSNDLHQLTPMLEKLKDTKKELKVSEKTNATLDCGYFNEEEILENKCDESVNIFLPDKKDAIKRNRSKRKPKAKAPLEGFEIEDFHYDKEKDIYICPEGKELHKKSKRPSRESSGRRIYEYRCRDCKRCKRRPSCTNNKKGRAIRISVNAETIAKYGEAMQSEASKDILSKRKEMVEHPFGTMKRNLGYTYFMQRGIEKIKTEFSFICFSYNIKRILNMFSVDFLINKLNEVYA